MNLQNVDEVKSIAVGDGLVEEVRGKVQVFDLAAG